MDRKGILESKDLQQEIESREGAEMQRILGIAWDAITRKQRMVTFYGCRKVNW